MIHIDALGLRLSRIVDHIVPIWRELPANLRGNFYVSDKEYKNVLKKYPDVNFQIFEKHIWAFRREKGPVITSMLSGVIREIVTAKRKTILVEHGCGDTFGIDSIKNPLSLSRKNDNLDILMYLAPGHHPAKVFKKLRPEVPVKLIGCPKMDAWHIRPPKPRSDPPVVVISFTWDWQDQEWGEWAKTVRGTWSYYKDFLPQLKNQNWKIYGNLHPKMWSKAAVVFKDLGIPLISFEEALEIGDLYICDQSSTIFEFASTGRPVVLLNAPWYQKDIQQGLRFWKAANIGMQVNEPDKLISTIEMALEDPEIIRKRRERIINYIYPVRDGTASKKAAAAIVSAIKKDSMFDLLMRPENKKIPVIAEKSFTFNNRKVNPGDQMYLCPEKAIRMQEKKLISIVKK